jgi:peptidoglycan/LPS O-acetylase OafA/YrhL
MPERSPSPAARPGRIAAFDVMRGLAILAVPYLHAYFTPWDVTPDRDQLFVRIVHLFAHSAVPVFFFISGYLLAREKPMPFWRFLRRKAVRIGIPVMFWMTAALFYEAWYQGGFSRALFESYAFFDIAGQFYYVFVLIVFYVALFPVRFLPARQLAWLTAGAFIASFVAVLYYETRVDDLYGDFSRMAYRNPMVWLFYPMFGMLAARAWPDLQWTRRLLPWALAGMAVLFAVYLYQGEVLGHYPVSYFGVTMYLFACCGLVAYPALLLSLPAWSGQALLPLRILGRYSFAIYLCHQPFFLGYLSTRLVSNNPRFNTDWFDLVHGIFLVGLLGSLAFVAAIDLVAPRLARLIMGVEGPPRDPPSGATRPAARPALADRESAAHS